MKKLDLEKHLKDNNCYLYREGGNHAIWKNRNNNKLSSVPRHGELSNILCKIICKQLEIEMPNKF